MTREATAAEVGAVVYVEALHELDRIVKFGRLAYLGFNLVEKLSDLKLVLAAHPEALSLLGALDYVETDLQTLAVSEREGGMAYLNALLTIRLLVVVEAVVQDAVLLSLEEIPEVLTNERVRKIKGPVVDLLEASPRERAVFLAEALTHERKSALQSGIGKFESILECVGLSGGIDPDVRRVMFELIEVRNVLVHRKGRADKRFTDSITWGRASIGTVVVVDEQMVEIYRLAAVCYIIEIIQRWIKRTDDTADIRKIVEAGQHGLPKLKAALSAG